jgi:hypothetical protein
VPRTLFSLCLFLVATAALPATPRDDLTTAVTQLRNAASYAWTTSTNDEVRSLVSQSGITEKGSYTLYSYTSDGVTTTSIRKGDQIVVQTGGGPWLRKDEQLNQRTPTSSGKYNLGESFALVAPPPPHSEISALLPEISEVKVVDGIYTSPLSAAAIARVYDRNGRGAPAAGAATGTARFWLNRGLLQRVEVEVRTRQQPTSALITAITLTDIGTAAVKVPDAAKKKFTP